MSFYPFLYFTANWDTNITMACRASFLFSWIAYERPRDVDLLESFVCFVFFYFYPAAWSPKGYGSDLSLPIRADDLFPPALPISDPRRTQAAA